MSEKGVEHLTQAAETLTRMADATGDDLLVLRLAVQALLQESPSAQEQYRQDLAAFIDQRLEEEQARRVEQRSAQMFPRLR